MGSGWARSWPARCLLMPRLYGQAHLIDTDTPGLLLWAATALAFWKGLHEPNARRWRVAVGILLGLAFVEKMAAVMVLLPLSALARRSAALTPTGGVERTGSTACSRPGRCWPRWRWPSSRSRSLQRQTCRSARVHEPVRPSAGERLAGRDPGRSAAGLVRPAAARPVVPQEHRSGGSSGRRSRPGRRSWPSLRSSAGWATRPGGAKRCPGWPTITRSARTGDGTLPDIQIIYFGQVYEFSLPWHNAWVLMGITVPVAILGAGGDRADLGPV